jgi:hypothetical protein
MTLFGLTSCGAEEPSAVDAQTTGNTAPSAIQELSFPGRTGEWRQATFQTESGETLELDYEVIDGEAVLQGDIRLPGEALDYRSAALTALGKRWPNAVVNVESSGLFNDARVTSAIAHWQGNTALRFNMGVTSGNRIRFVNPSDPNVCDSALGMSGGAQTINLGNNCGTGAAIHEIGHAIGLFHEQQRTDRDAFVNIISGCIQSGKSHNFNKFGTDGMNIGPYDIDSVMHYPSWAFLDTSKPECTATVTRKDGSTFGQRQALDAGDIAGASSLYYAWTRLANRLDWDSDLKTDFGTWRPSSGNWAVRSSHDGGVWNLALGSGTDVPVPGDYDGDAHGDIAVWRPSTGMWSVNFSTTHQVASTQWGANTDIPVPADYDRDGMTNFAVWRPLEGTWYIRLRNGGLSTTQWGTIGDVPLPADYDRDGQADIAVWRPSTGTWFILNSSNGSVREQQWGGAGDVPVAADYDGDGTIDVAVWRPSSGTWFILNSSNGSVTQRQWGLISDVPVPGDYDGSGAVNITVWRPSNGTWYVLSDDGASFTSRQFGANGDVLVP